MYVGDVCGGMEEWVVRMLRIIVKILKELAEELLLKNIRENSS